MAFETLTSPDGVVWRRSSLLARAEVPHGFSTRLGGVSAAPFESLNLGLADAPGETDSWSNVSENWRRFLAAVGLQQRLLVRARQVHGQQVLQPGLQPHAVRAEPPFADGDALVTADARHALAVRVADCAPVLLADRHAGLVAAVHAGWRGLVGGVVIAALQRMLDRGARADRVVAAVGGCIGAGAFQVGPDVRQAMQEVGLGAFVTPDAAAPDRWRADLRGGIVAQLAEGGVGGERVDVDPSCTVDCRAELFSYRREGARSGRMACIIGL